MIEAMIGALATMAVLLLALMLKRLSDIDVKLDRHIEESADFRADLRVLQDRWERK